MDQSTELSRPAVGALPQYLYEYRKGVRHLFMMTLSAHEAAQVGRRLEREAVDFHVHPVGEAKANLFFGRPPCVALVRTMLTKPLNQLSPEEDFILGTLLGYDREQQCLRFLTRSGRSGALRAG